MGTRATDELDHLGDPLLIEVGDASGTGSALGDLTLIGGGLVVDGETTHPVVHRAGDPGGTDRVERIHRGDQPEAGSGGESTEAGHVQLALAHHGDEHVERLLRHAIDLLHVEQRALAQGGRQRAVDEHIGVVALREYTGRVEVPDET